MCAGSKDIELNQFMTSAVLVNWCTPVAVTTFLLILSSICLLTSPISDLKGLIRRQVVLFRKFSLWSFKFMNDSFFAGASILSLSSSFLAIFISFFNNAFEGVWVCFSIVLRDVALYQIEICLFVKFV